MYCVACFREEAHHHIVVEDGLVTEVWYSPRQNILYVSAR
jgi:hypothetical protein